MARFTFYEDSKVIAWERTEFEVDAENEAEAIAKVREIAKTGDVSAIADDDIEVGDRYMLNADEAPVEYIRLENNNGHMTTEYLLGDKQVADNLNNN